jgi:hypothetical protein
MPEECSRPGIRVSDGDRSAVAQRLVRALADGRLSVDEFEERTFAAYGAVTRDQLVELTRDLPGPLW